MTGGGFNCAYFRASAGKVLARSRRNRLRGSRTRSTLPGSLASSSKQRAQNESKRLINGAILRIAEERMTAG